MGYATAVLVIGFFVGCGASTPRAPTDGAAPASTEADSNATAHSAATTGPGPQDATPSREALARARRLLNRLTWGPRPGEVERTARDLDAFLSRQQRVVPTEVGEAAGALAGRFPVFDPPRVLATRFPKGPARKVSMDPAADGNHKALLHMLQELAIVRAIEGEGQLDALLQDFYFNHLNVFGGKGAVVYFLREYGSNVIAAHLTGTFERMLLTSARHPAMLLYLDNANSIAARPNAKGKRARRGLNENYARELLELHTLGVRAGYTQADVHDTARLLTGWNLKGTKGVQASQRYVFRKGQHDTGPKTILGRPYAAGEAEGKRLLADLAANAHTKARLASRLAQRFLGDEPNQAMQSQLIAAYGERGQLAPLQATLVRLVDAGAGSKFKTGFEYVVSAARLVGASVAAPDKVRAAVQRLGMLPYGQALPTGYPFASDAWLSTGAMVARTQVAWSLAHSRLGLAFDLDRAVPRSTGGDPAASVVVWAEQRVGPLSQSTRQALQSVSGDDDASRRSRLALLLASPEFMQR